MKFSPLRDKILTLALTGQLVEQRDAEPEVQQIGPAPAPDEVPFAIPAKWKWVKLDQVFSMASGKFIKSALIKDEGAHPCYGGNGLRGYTDSFNVSGTFNLIGRQGALCGNVHLVSGDFYATEHAVVARHSEKIDPRCAFYFLTKLDLNQYATATAQLGLAVSRIAEVYYPLPPLEEQRRLAAVLDDLMAHLDQMEQAYSELTGPMSDHFRDLMLQQAISGQLVPQLDSEPEVEQVGPAPAPDEVPFALPAKWKWVKFESVLELISGRDLTLAQISSTPDEVMTPYVTGASQIEDGAILINRWTAQPSVISEEGDVLLTCKGTVGKLALNSYGSMHIARQIMAVRCGLLCEPSFVLMYLQSFMSKLKANAKGLIPGITRKDVLGLWLPLPPLEEQRRIVTKLDELFAGVKQLSSLKEFGLE